MAAVISIEPRRINLSIIRLLDKSPKYDNPSPALSSDKNRLKLSYTFFIKANRAICLMRFI